METTKIKLDGLVLVRPQVFKDNRGFFLESFSDERYRDLGIDCPFVQDNHSLSEKGSLRGMHFQSSPGQAKLVRCGIGRIFDVAVDMRRESPTFGQWQGFYLDGESHHQLFVPVGFAHGFCVVSDYAHVMYKVSAPYEAATESGFRWDDSDIGIDWPISDPNLSKRDQTSPMFRELLD